jgi:ATP-dependent DNA helicase DinG
LDPLPLWWGELPRFEVCANAEDCLHYRCRYYRYCLLHAARRQAEQADIVVTNHALLFCDVMAERGILPPIRHWLIDEAHGVEAEARRQLAVSLETRSLRALLDGLLHQGGTLSQIKRYADAQEGGLLVSRLADKALADSQAIQAVAQSFFSYLKDLVYSGLAEQSSYDRVDIWINEAVRDSGPWSLLASAGKALLERLKLLIKACRDLSSAAAEYEELLELNTDLAGLTAQVSTAAAALELIITGSNQDYYYWAELDRRENSSTDKLLAARLDIGTVLLEQLYPEAMSVIYTSDTIATADSSVANKETTSPFSYFEQGVGLSRLPEERRGSLQIASSYDFEHNMTVLLPTNMPEPNQGGYSDRLDELLHSLHLAMGGSTLTLFTNRREMERHFVNLKDSLAEAGITLRCQFRGTSTKRLRDEFLQDKNLCLFALRSFWEGFDAPGDTLRCVVIPKLPFGRPNDPLQKERECREGRAAWRRYVLPEAVIDLKQAAGRLIRSSTDSGYLVLADSRLLSKFYGQAFLEALPSQNQLRMSIEEIAKYVR